jgi:hypothetical protein
MNLSRQFADWNQANAAQPKGKAMDPDENRHQPLPDGLSPRDQDVRKRNDVQPCSTCLRQKSYEKPAGAVSLQFNRPLESPQIATRHGVCSLEKQWRASNL